MNKYYQLCGALGVLKQNDGVDLDWVEIKEQMRDLGRRVGIAHFGDPIANTVATGFTDPVHEEVRAIHRKYRDMCLELGLIQRGYLFDDHDAAAL